MCLTVWKIDYMNADVWRDGHMEIEVENGDVRTHVQLSGAGGSAVDVGDSGSDVSAVASSICYPRGMSLHNHLYLRLLRYSRVCSNINPAQRPLPPHHQESGRNRNTHYAHTSHCSDAVRAWERSDKVRKSRLSNGAAVGEIFGTLDDPLHMRSLQIQDKRWRAHL